MLRAIIADDEPKIRNIIIRKGNWAELGMEIAAEAQNGDMLCELAELHKPHIVITDMRMPGINGAELIRFLAENYPHMQLLVISGYSDFEYMKQAVNSGVVDYILKPISQEELNKALSNAVCRIASQQKRQELERKQVQTLSLAQESLINRFLSGINVDESALVDALSLPRSDTDRRFRAVIILLRDIDKVCVKAFNGDVNLFIYGILNIINELVGSNGKAFRLAGAERLALILWDSLDDSAIKQQISVCSEKVSKHMGIRAEFAVGGIANSLADLPHSVGQAQQVTGHFLVKEEANIRFYEDEQLHARIRSYIEAHYAERLTVNELAGAFYISPQYLTRIFKEHYGIAPYEYIMLLKIERAKQMLANGQHKSKEILAELSFIDESHFSKTFKRIVGVSPKKYH